MGEVRSSWSRKGGLVFGPSEEVVRCGGEASQLSLDKSRMELP